MGDFTGFAVGVQVLPLSALRASHLGELMNQLMLIITLLLALSMTLAADNIYRTVNADGTISFSDVPPGEGQAEAIPMPEMVNIQSVDQRSEQQIQDYKRDRRERDQYQQAKQQAINAAKSQLASAKQAQREGKAVIEGDRSNFKTGSRLNQNYFDRQARLESDVERAEQALRDARRLSVETPAEQAGEY